MRFVFEDGSYFAIRPSGTEPKCKIYFSICAETKQEVEEVNISILDKEGKEITKLGGVIGEIEPGGTIKLNVAVSANIINANDIIIEEKV